MIELTVTKTSENPSVFTLSPSSIEIGGKDSSLIDSIHVNIPEEWQGKVIRATFNQSALYGGNTIPKILNADGIIELKSDVTLCSGDLVIDAVGVDGSVSPSTGCHYTVYSHPKFGGTEQDVTPSEYQQFVAETKVYSDSAQANATAADESKKAAALSEQNAKSSETAAQTAQEAAETAKEAAETAKEAAETNATAAQGSAEAAARSEANSKNSEMAAKTSETNSKTSETSSANSEVLAAVSATAAETSKNSAAQSAEAAEASANKAIEYTTIFQNSGYHNSIYRGKDISANEADGSMYTNISSGTFDDIFVGDYFTKTINGTNYVLRVAGCDSYLNRGDTALTKHHIVVVPDTAWSTCPISNTGSIDGGYVSSQMYTDTLPLWAGYLTTAFGTHLLTLRELLVNAISSTTPSGWALFDSKVGLMTSEEVAGCGAFGVFSSGYSFNIGIAYGQLPLFRLSPDRICIRHMYWLRNIVNIATFAVIDASGNLERNNVANSQWLRPKFLLG